MRQEQQPEAAITLQAIARDIAMLKKKIEAVALEVSGLWVALANFGLTPSDMNTTNGQDFLDEEPGESTTPIN